MSLHWGKYRRLFCLESPWELGEGLKGTKGFFRTHWGYKETINRIPKQQGSFLESLLLFSKGLWILRSWGSPHITGQQRRLFWILNTSWDNCGFKLSGKGLGRETALQLLFALWQQEHLEIVQVSPERSRKGKCIACQWTSSECGRPSECYGFIKNTGAGMSKWNADKESY